MRLAQLSACFLFLFSLLSPNFLSAQCPQTGFTVGSGCSGAPVTITNTTTGGNYQYDWDFCSGDLQLDSFTTSSFGTSSALGIDIRGLKTVFDGSNWYVFVSCWNNSAVFRIDFGNSLNNSPSNPVQLTGLGIGTGGPANLDIVKEGNHWYGLLIINDVSLIYRLDFGTSLANNPSSTLLAGSRTWGLYEPEDIKHVYENDSLYVLIANHRDNSLSIINFGTTVATIPGFSNYINLPYLSNFYHSGATSLDVVRYCTNWYVITSNNIYGSLEIMKFQNGIFNTNVDTAYIFPQLYAGKLSQMQVVEEGGQYKCFAVTKSNTNSTLHYFNLGSDLSNIHNLQNVATDTTLTLVGNHSTVSVAEQNSKWFVLSIDEIAPTIDKLNIQDHCSASQLTSTLQNPGSVTYSALGSYKVTLCATDTATHNQKCTTQTVSVQSAPVANFGYRNICRGDSTRFIDSTAVVGSTVSGYHWDFGDTKSSTVQNPVHLYADTGRYTVTLITNGANGCNDQISKVFHVSEVPHANFTVVANCQRDSVRFTDLSTVAGFDPISNWRWTFGGLDSSVRRSPVQSFDTSGSFTAKLIVSNSSGCRDSTTRPFVLKGKPTYHVTYQNTCVGDSLQFFNNSTLPNGVTLTSNNWAFGDGFGSTAASPKHRYATSGNFTAKLYNTLSNGCQDSLAFPLHVGTPPVANFSATTICQNYPISFRDLSRGTSDTIYKWLWKFGNGDSSIVQNPTYTFTNSGTFNVTLRAISPSDCGNNITKSIKVLPTPITAFKADSVCFGDTVKFVNQTTIAAPATVKSWKWYFGNRHGDSSIVRTPQLYYDTVGHYSARLIAVSDSGCVDTAFRTVKVNSIPLASFLVTTSCALAHTGFTDRSSVLLPDTLNQWLWSFGDLTSSPLQNPIHIFANQGRYPVKLKVTSSGGCSASTIDTVLVHSRLKADFTFTDNCKGDSTFFADNSISDTLPLYRNQWIFGRDPLVDGVTSLKYKYNGADTFNVVYRIVNPYSCADTVIKQVIIHSKPMAKFGSPNICQYNFYNPTDSSIVIGDSINSWTWTIAGNTFNTQYPSLQFNNTGSYPITLSVSTKSGCTDSTSGTTNIAPGPKASFTLSPTIAEPPALITFNNTSTNASSYFWNFGDTLGTATNASPTYTFTKNGTFTVLLVASNLLGCADSTTRTFYSAPTDLDLAVDNLVVTPITQADGSTLLQVSVRLLNVGTRVITTAQLFVRIGNNGEYEEDWNGVLNSGSTTNYTFITRYPISGSFSSKYVCVEAKNVDGNEQEISYTNNSICQSLDGNIQFAGPYPNPATTDATLGIILPKAATVNVAMFDMLGQNVIYNNDFQLTEGRNNLNLQTDQLLYGSYVVRVKYNDNVYKFTLFVKK